METNKEKLRNFIISNNTREVTELLQNGFDPNFENGWPIRLAARYGIQSIVKLLIQFGANPHILSEAGASTLQLAVFSGLHWDNDGWTDLLSCCDSSQLADGAAVAIIFNNIAALSKILQTRRCNTHIPTSLTGKTVENLAKGYKLQYLLNFPVVSSQNTLQVTTNTTPRLTRTGYRGENAQINRNLSPSVARFFDLSANQPSLSLPHSPMGLILSPPAQAQQM